MAGQDKEVLVNGTLSTEEDETLESFYRNNVNFQAKVRAVPVIKEATLDEVKSNLTDLNKSFLAACNLSLRDVGHSSNLVPVVADYLTEAISIMSKFRSREGLRETGLVLQDIVEHYYVHLFSLENKTNKSDPNPISSVSGFKSTTSTTLTKSDKPSNEFNFFSSTSTSSPKNSEVNSSPSSLDQNCISAFNFKHPPMANPGPNPLSQSNSKPPSPSKSLFNFGNNPSKSPANSTFSFTSTTTSTTPPSSFFTLPTQQPNTIFSSSFMAPPPTSSSSQSQGLGSSAQNSTGGNAAVEDEDEKAEKEAQSHEMTRVVEDDALFSIKCKLFEKLPKKDSYTVRGVGVLYLKKIENDEGYQVLVRADNSYGKLLLNLKLDPGLPMTLSKNNIMTADPHAKTPLIIRVKAEEDSKKLFDQINKCLKT